MFTSSSQGEYFSQNLLLQDDGKLVCMGTSAWYNGAEDYVVERYNNTPLSVPEFETVNLSAVPNPSSGTVTLTYDFVQGQEILYQINDVSGKLLHTGSLSGDRHTVDLSHLGTGMYFLNAGQTTLRLVKE
jgi:hypothetical protein